ncbi:MAG: hypothetical protein SF051_12295 [Elusimicrobiota bacterium]|nr:hypothetical protein [Elusimicrobiota bacterium]
MAPRRLTQINAVTIALSLLLAVPGSHAWAAVASVTRPVASGGAMSGAAGAVRVSARPAVLTPSLLASPLAGRSPLLAAPRAVAPAMTPDAAALPAAADAPRAPPCSATA